MKTRTILFSAVALAAFATGACAAPAAQPVGPVVVAKTIGNALLIWQANQFVADMQRRAVPSGQTVEELESAALQIIASHKTQLHGASSVSIRVMATSVAGTSDKEYAPTSFAGFKQILVLTVTESALSQSAHWPEVVNPSQLPPGVTAQVAAGQ